MRIKKEKKMYIFNEILFALNCVSIKKEKIKINIYDG